jgi:uncharacterized membrane protein YdjX (TVP38/TMEM64 family)
MTEPDLGQESESEQEPDIKPEPKPEQASELAEQESESAENPDMKSDEEPDTEPNGQPKKRVSSADKLKFFGLVAFFLLMIAASIAGISYINSVGTETLLVDLEQAIKDAGPFGVIICLLLQFIQVVVAFVPGEVVQLAIGYMYGTVWGGIITVCGALISSIFVFYLARKLGAPFVQSMIGNKDSKRMRFLRNSKNIDSLVLILYLIPGLPKDLFTYVFPLTDIKPSAFFVLSTIARMPAIFASTFVSASFRSGDYVQMAIVAVIFGVLGVLGIIFNQKIMELVERLLSKVSPRQRHQKKDVDA